MRYFFLSLLLSCQGFPVKQKAYEDHEFILFLPFKKAMTLTQKVISKIPGDPKVIIKKRNHQLITNKFINQVIEDLNVPIQVRTYTRLVVSFYSKGENETLLKITKYLTPLPSIHETSKIYPSDGLLEKALENRMKLLSGLSLN